MVKQWIAILDERGVLVGFDKSPVKISEAAVMVPEGCDLVPGKYRWTGTMFWPMEKSSKLLREKLAREMPACFYLLVKFLQRQGDAPMMPEKILKWIENYKPFIEKEK
jgi:hypothetical protein